MITIEENGRAILLFQNKKSRPVWTAFLCVNRLLFLTILNN
jgi:hypothetical protein